MGTPARQHRAHQTPQVILMAFARRAREANMEFEPEAVVQKRIAEGCRNDR